MNINRNNYEEYFLLYADNELTATEKRIVDVFLQENVDLKEEFLMIQMTVNTPEQEINLLDKSFLLKKEPPFITENNYEEIFVLFHDQQLSEEEMEETKLFISSHPKTEIDFGLIRDAKFIPDTFVVYPNKKDLYRKEKAGKVIPLILWRSMAAAAFLGFGLWVTISYFNGNEVNQPVATTIHKSQPPAIKEAIPSEEKPKIDEKTVASSEKIGTFHKKPKVEIDKKDFLQEAKRNDVLIAKSINRVNMPVVVPIIKSVKTNDNLQLAKSAEPIKELPVNIGITENSLAINNVQGNNAGIDQEVSKPNYPPTASYVSNSDQKNDNYVFYDVSAEEFRKSKVGGFLKKVRRIVERTNPVARLLGEEDQMAAK